MKPRFRIRVAWVSDGQPFYHVQRLYWGILWGDISFHPMPRERAQTAVDELNKWCP